MQTAIREDNFDVVVVGAGVGGCIVAARIAQFGVNPANGERLKVALFEYGPYHKSDLLRGYGSVARRATFDGMPYELSRRYMLPWGSLGMVGGSTQWAGMIAFPPTPLDFEHWQAETGVDWTWENFNLPMAEVNEMWHPFPEPDAVHSPGQLRFRDAALAMGYPVGKAGQAKLNCPRCGDCNGRFCKYDAKSTPLVTYVPIAEREGVQIFPQTPVEKVLLAKKGSRAVATGVLYRTNGDLREARAAKVILSCGYNGTPRLLFRSGYGPREKVHGELLAENRNVGANVCASVSAPSIKAFFDTPIKHPDIGVHAVYYVWKDFDPRGYNHLMIRESLGAKEGTRDFPDENALGPLAPEFGRAHKQYMKKVGTHAGGVAVELSKNAVRGQINTEGRIVTGTHTARSGETEGVLTKDFLQQNHPEILEALREGQEITYKILTRMGATQVVGHDRLPDRITFHFSTSTCRAGASRENSVINSDFESHDVDNLLICDSSSPPNQATANVSMPTAAVCCYAWRRIVTKHFSRA